MEKVKIKSCVKKNNNLFIIELSDGRKGTSFDDLTTKINQDIELEIKNAKEYQGVMQYYFNLPGEKKQGKYAMKDYTFEKRKASLDAAINWCLPKAGLKTQDILDCATVFFKYLNEK